MISTSSDAPVTCPIASATFLTRRVTLFFISSPDHSVHIPDHEHFAVTACTLQGMARVRSGQALAWPLVLTGVSAVVSRVKRDFACASTGPFPPVLVVLRAQSRLGLEGRARTLSGPSPDLTSSVSVLTKRE
jgi:hypothetical protein